mmetsp:Transcript_17855/g.23368  ORF Transcript_17855/g.23368 Transcript_17855/m.23368 type:complete len:305 (+) Transcript_17855:280-1194(+)
MDTMRSAILLLVLAATILFLSVHTSSWSNSLVEVALTKGTKSSKGELAATIQKRYTWGFFLQAFKHPKATLEVVKSVRKFYPDEYFFLVSDHGYDFKPLSERFSLNYEAGKQKVSSQGAHSGREFTARYMRRILHAALHCDCDYMVILEDDNQMLRKIRTIPKYDAGGVTAHLWTRVWSSELKKSYGAGDWSYESHGMCGGSYVKTSSYIEALSNHEWEKRLVDMGKYMPRLDIKTDLAIASIMMSYGYELHPWVEELSQPGKPNQNPDPAIIHNTKKWYNVLLTPEDGKVVSDFPVKNPNRTL